MSKTFISMIRDGADSSIVYAGPDHQVALSIKPEDVDIAEDLVVLVWEDGKEIGKYINSRYIDYSKES